MDRKPTPKWAFSRRDFLKSAPAVVAGGVLLGIMAGKPLLSRLGRRRQATEFPKGSIFTPAKDQQKRL